MAPVSANPSRSQSGEKDIAGGFVFAILADPGDQPLHISDICRLAELAAEIGARHVYVFAQIKPALDPNAAVNEAGWSISSDYELPEGAIWRGEKADARLTILPLGAGRSTFTAAVKQVGDANLRGDKTHNDVEAAIGAALETLLGPPPDLLLVCGGASNLHGATTWTVAYTELVFSKTRCSDLEMPDLAAAAGSFMTRERRFGGLTDGADG